MSSPRRCRSSRIAALARPRRVRSMRAGRRWTRSVRACSQASLVARTTYPARVNMNGSEHPVGNALRVQHHQHAGDRRRAGDKHTSEASGRRISTG